MSVNIYPTGEIKRVLYFCTT